MIKQFWILTKGTSADGRGTGQPSYYTEDEAVAEAWEKQCREDPYCTGHAVHYSLLVAQLTDLKGNR